MIRMVRGGIEEEDGTWNDVDKTSSVRVPGR